MFNSAALVDASGLRCVYRKAHLWDAEPRWFARGAAPPAVVTTQHGRIAVMICYDLEFPEWVRLPALDGAQLLCAPVNWPAYPRPDGERPAEVVRVQAGAAVNRMFIAACDRIGPERGVGWVGGSVIVDADGWPLAGGSASGQPATLLADCDLARHWTRASARITTCSATGGQSYMAASLRLLLEPLRPRRRPAAACRACGR